MSTTTQTTAQFSMTIDILGSTIPFNSGEISQLPSKSSTENALDNLIQNGLTFSTPSDFTLNLPLANFVTWLQGKGFDLPTGLSDFFDQTNITIFHASVSTTGSFSFSFSVDFNPALGSNLTNGMFEIDNIGLSISHTVSKSS